MCDVPPLVLTSIHHLVPSLASGAHSWITHSFCALTSSLRALTLTVSLLAAVSMAATSFDLCPLTGLVCRQLLRTTAASNAPADVLAHDADQELFRNALHNGEYLRNLVTVVFVTHNEPCCLCAAVAFWSAVCK